MPLLLALLALLPVGVSGDAAIRGPAGPSEIVVRTTTRTAGAIDSLTWDGKEFLDSADHGRQLQSASNFDAGSRFAAETFNPTEAGSMRDGAGPTSSSELLRLSADGNRLETASRMAFWLRPGESSGGRPAKNRTVLSEHVLKKSVTVGALGLPHVVEYDATFVVPKGEKHRYAQFEAVTGYMPPEFSVFRTLDPETGRLAALSDGPGEQSLPVVFSTPDGRHAMGVYAPAVAGSAGPGYGRFRFEAQRVVKWNAVFRVRDASGVEPGDYVYRCYVAVGTLDDVRRALQAVHDRVDREGEP